MKITEDNRKHKKSTLLSDTKLGKDIAQDLICCHLACYLIKVVQNLSDILSQDGKTSKYD